jgi:hypothetical protein
MNSSVAHPPQSVPYWTSLRNAFRATLLLTDSQVELTAWGKLLQTLLCLTEPVLLGLALATRARTNVDAVSRPTAVAANGRFAASTAHRPRLGLGCRNSNGTLQLAAFAATTRRRPHRGGRATPRVP